MTADFETVPPGTLAKMERMREALRNCADDLESELKARYAGTLDYPSMKARYDRDMEPVVEARAALEDTL